MLVTVFPAQAFATNCYVLARTAGEPCVIIDPGIGIEAKLQAVLVQHRLTPAAVILTHGHLDHVYAVAAVTEANLTAYIHTEDRYRLIDPLAGVSPALIGAVEAEFGQRATWTAPDQVEEITGGDKLALAGLDFEVIHAPGHTEGSMLLAIQEVPDALQAPEELDRTVFSGDVLFAGSIGRTDLPGGDHPTMEHTLRTVVLDQPDSALVLPGHGPATTMRRERASNPFLQGLGA